MAKDQPKDTFTVAKLSGDTVSLNSSMAWLEYLMQMLTAVSVNRPMDGQKQTDGITGKKNKNKNKNHTWNPQISTELPDALKLTSLKEVVTVR